MGGFTQQRICSPESGHCSRAHFIAYVSSADPAMRHLGQRRAGLITPWLPPFTAGVAGAQPVPSTRTQNENKTNTNSEPKIGSNQNVTNILKNGIIHVTLP
jgi:hypothetical protein